MIGDPFQTQTIDLSTAAVGVEVAQAGHYVKLIGASASSAIVYAAINAQTGRTFKLQRGGGWQHGPFERLFLTWPAQSGVSIELAVAGDPNKARPELFELFSRDAVASSVVENTSENPVPVEINGGAVLDVQETPWTPSTEYSPLIRGGITNSVSWSRVYQAGAGRKLRFRRSGAQANSWAGTELNVQIRNAGNIPQGNMRYAGPSVVDLLAGLDLPSGWSVWIASTTNGTYASLYANVVESADSTVVPVFHVDACGVPGIVGDYAACGQTPTNSTRLQYYRVDNNAYYVWWDQPNNKWKFSTRGLTDVWYQIDSAQASPPNGTYSAVSGSGTVPVITYY